MGQFIDLSNRLTNDVATIKIDEKHIYPVNRSKNAGILIQQLAKDDKLDSFERLDKTIEIGLGKEALKYINSLNLTVTQYIDIGIAIAATINEVPFEEMKKKAKEAEEQNTDSFRK